MREELAANLQNSGDTPTEPVATVTSDVTAEADQPETQALAVIEPPANWPAEKRETFGQLPRELQEYLVARDKEANESFTRKTTELANQRKSYEELLGVIEPYKQQMELAGITPGQAIQRLFAAQQMLDKSPLEGLKWLAQSYQVDLSALTPQEESYVDPAVKALRDELNQLKQQQAQRQQQEQQQNLATVNKQIADFRDAKDEQGNAKYPYFDKLRTLMGPLVAEGKTLAEAYDLAKYTLPEELERVKSEVEKTARADAIKKAEEARKAKAKDAASTAPIIRSRGVGTEDGKPKTLRDELRAALNSQTTGRI